MSNWLCEYKFVFQLVLTIKFLTEHGRHDALKNYPLLAFGLNDGERATRLFKFQRPGDHKPSELMNYMLSLLGSHEPCFLFRHLFLSQLDLPEFEKIPISMSTATDPRELDI